MEMEAEHIHLLETNYMCFSNQTFPMHTKDSLLVTILRQSQVSKFISLIKCLIDIMTRCIFRPVLNLTLMPLLSLLTTPYVEHRFDKDQNVA